MSYINGTPRTQINLFPESIEDLVPPDHLVRVIDAFVDYLDLKAQGFTGAQENVMGRPRYAPQDLLKLYLYGYLNQVRSSRKLARECQRNVELMWLLNRLSPDFKTIADFRKDNARPLKRAGRAFVCFCKEAQVFGQEVAIDGSKFQAAASRDQVITRQQATQRIAKVDQQIERYLMQLDQADQDDTTHTPSTASVQAALERLAQKKAQLEADQTAMQQGNKQQHCRTEPDAQLMKSGRQGMILGYNIQHAVDTRHKLIIHHQVRQSASDSGELYRMSRMAQATLQAERLQVLADTGYSSGTHLHRCDQRGIQATVPVNRAMNNQNQGRHYQKSDFTFDAQSNTYRCPAGEVLTYKTCNRKERLYLYTTSACGECRQKSACTTGQQRWLSRHFYEAAFVRSQDRLAQDPGAMNRRQGSVEAPFATIKRMMGNGRFLCRGLTSVKAEAALHTLAYNLKRLINLMGVETLLQKLAAA